MGNSGVIGDPEFNFALDRFKRLAADGGYPHHVDSLSGPINLQFVPQQSVLHQPVHQFWKGEKEWPLFQIGPGIIMVNETAANYD